MTRLQGGSTLQAGAREARTELLSLRFAVSCGKSKILISLYKVIFLPYLDYLVRTWAPSLGKGCGQSRRCPKVSHQIG